MKMRYTHLRGLPVRSVDGEVLGRLADLVVRRSGEEAVCESLQVVPSTLFLPSARLGRGIELLTIPSGDLAKVDDKEIRLRFSRQHYGSAP